MTVDGTVKAVGTQIQTFNVGDTVYGATVTLSRKSGIVRRVACR